MKDHITVLWTSVLLQVAASQSLPYNPTTILLPPPSSKERDIAYAFLPATDSTTQFVSLNISSSISTSNLSFQTISAGPPFLDSNSNAFIPSISPRGEISVYTGSCTTSTSSELWSFTSSNTSEIGNGTWAQETTNTASDVTAASLPGADFLSSAFSFSTLVNGTASQTKIYIFGGMCPSSIATASTWQSSASYSNNMLRLAPTSSGSQMAYTLDLTTSRGPPIAEAGFSITGLTPTYSNGSGIETQQQSFVLVGGHTQTAFINMSQVAIWSLPEESWSFVTVDAPSAKGNTELAVKDVTSVDSRSGHTAVLTEDGGSIVIFGGWVGDVGQAADPQLAVLKLGQGFGGSGDWTWTVPGNQPSGSGIYGHGAVMLPGNVMMVLGGYNTSSSGSSKREVASGTQAQFFNATSMTWTTDYTNPAYVAAAASSSAAASSKAHSTSTSTKAGLGAGLGLGLAAILGALLFYFFYNRRLRQRRNEAREKDLRDLSFGAATYYEAPRREMSQGGAFPWSNGGWSGRNNGEVQGPVHESNSTVAGYENLLMGTHGLGDQSQIPHPPTRQIPRKPLHSRNARGIYQPTPTFDSASGHGRANSLGTAGPIHPIYEADEEDPTQPIVEGVGIAIGDPSYVPSPAEPNRYSDPFKDPPLANFSVPIRRNRSVSSSEAESRAHSREREIQEWVSDWAAADAMLNSQTRTHSNMGRISPTRRAQLIAATNVSSVSGEEDGRTASNLSERTERSVAISTMSVSRSGSGSQRSGSLRGFITGMNPFTTIVQSTTVTSQSISPVFDTQTGLPLPRSAGSGSSTSFSTARTSFPILQAEGESLLPRPENETVGEHSPTRGDYSPTYLHPDFVQGSPSKSKPSALAKGRRGWLGSLRKVFDGTAPGEANLVPAPIYRDVSPTRDSSPPRRTVSASATLWRRKQGRGDWDDSVDIHNPRSNTFTGESFPSYNPNGRDVAREEEEEDEDWDIERAVQNRVVQVMFTVPKERLRVVNVDEADVGSEAGTSVGGSLRSRKSVKRAPIPFFTDDADVEGEGEGEGESLLVDVDGDDIPGPEVVEEGKEGKGKGKEVDHEDLISPPLRTESPGRKTKVLEIVDEIEARSGPER